MSQSVVCQNEVLFLIVLDCHKHLTLVFTNSTFIKSTHVFSTVFSLVYLFVPGASNFCVACGHGGHTYHLMTWFESMDMCPSGCGCRCLEVGTFIVD